MKVYCTNYSTGYASWLAPLGFQNTLKVEEADLLLITGGTDVNPVLYRQKSGRYTDRPDIMRDVEESKLFHEFVKNGKPILGVCRGSQLVCVLNGGELVQHSRHPYYHPVHTQGPEFASVISTHHQQALLRKVKNYDLIAWANKLSPAHLDGEDNDYNFPSDYKEPEIVYYPDSGSLAIQSHPEMMPLANSWVKFCQQIVSEKLLNIK